MIRQSDPDTGADCKTLHSKAVPRHEKRCGGLFRIPRIVSGPVCLNLVFDSLEQRDVLRRGVHHVGIGLRDLRLCKLAEHARRSGILLRLTGLTGQQVGDDDVSGGLHQAAGMEILESADLLVAGLDPGLHLRELDGQLLELRHHGTHRLRVAFSGIAPDLLQERALRHGVDRRNDLQLRGSLVDVHNACVAVQPLAGIVLHKTRSAVDLDGVVGPIDLVNDVTLSQTSGFSTYKDNMGQVANKGVELKLRADIYRDRNWNVALWGNMAHNKNEILKISDSQKAYNERVAAYYKNEALYQETLGLSHGAEYSVPLPQYEEGASLTSIWAVRSLGIDPTTGKEIFLNRDGSIADKWNAAQEVVVGNTEPKCSGAFGLNLSYKNWTLFASFLYEWGGQEYNQTLVNNVENADLVNKNVDLRVLTDRWKKPGDIAQFKDIKDRGMTTLPTSRFVQDKALVRLNSLNVSYDFNRDWIKKHLRMNLLRLEASTSDLINWSSIKQERGLSYPRSWKVEFSLKAQF